jgi:hypothetical protein
MNQEPELKAIYATPGIFTGAPKASQRRGDCEEEADDSEGG